MEYDMPALMRLAQSPAGRQLLELLQKNGGKELQAAVSQASAGNYDQAKQLLSALLASPEAKSLLKQMEDSR